MSLTSADVAAIQRRTLRVLVLGQVAGSAALAAAVTVGAFVVQEILGQKTPWGGIASATVTMGTAIMAQVLARRMSGSGRRSGLVLGYSLAISGGLVAGWGVERQSLPIFLVGLFFFGNGQAANLLSRYAATDLALPAERGRAMSRILFASTFGAVFGPLLIQPAQELGIALFGWRQYTGPWVFAGLFFLTSLFNALMRLRPDPLHVQREMADTPAGEPPKAGFREMFGVLRMSRLAQLAFGSMAISQATMVAVMTMTPVHLKEHGYESLSQFVISLHIAGMFAFSPLVGKFSDRKGRLATIVTGAGLTIAATALAALSGESATLLFPALWLLGIGWSFGLIGGSSLLVDAIPADLRIRTQGAADLLMSGCGALAGFSSGFIRSAVGYHVLSLSSLGFAAVLLAWTTWRMAVVD
jgi:MFS family permease